MELKRIAEVTTLQQALSAKSSDIRGKNKELKRLTEKLNVEKFERDRLEDK